jgi:CRP/FNR family transcriptional regulator, cyclic AMP receptor protein
VDEITVGRMKLFSQDTKVEALRRATLFEGLSRKQLVQLARVSEDLEVPAGKVLCKEGEVGQEFFVIIDGEAEVTKNGERLATRGAGEFFGEIALLEQTQRMATVTAQTPLRFFVLTRRDFRQLIRDNPGVELKVLQAVARRLIQVSGDPTLA